MSISISDSNLFNYLKNITSLTGGSALSGTESSASQTSVFAELMTSMMQNIQREEAVTAANTPKQPLAIDLDAIFQKAADTYDVPINLLKAVAKAESNFDPAAESRSGAMGVMQLMPGTAASLGVTNAFDPEQNIMGGANYLSQMLEQVNGNVEVALAAYNAGPGTVQKYHGIPPFPETQNYIAKVLNYAQEDLNAGIVAVAQTGTVPAEATSTDSLLAGITAKDLSTMMTLYRYQTQLSALTTVSNVLGDSTDTFF